VALTKREKYIGAGVGAAFVLLVMNQLVLEPYFDDLNVVHNNKAAEDKRQADRVVLFNRQSKLKKVWTQITDDGLTDNESIAASQARGAVQAWAEASYVSLTSTKAERTTESNGLPFEVISFHVTATGSTPSISHFLLSLETARVPVRVMEMKIEPQKEGTDDLKMELTISTLCRKPDVDVTADNGVSSAGEPAEASTWN